MAAPASRGARVTTRTGDTGDTALWGRARVRKTHPRVVALGELDEAQAALGVARATVRGAAKRTLLDLQRGLYLVMAEVGATPANVRRLTAKIDAPAVATIDELGRIVRAHTIVEGRFVIPGEDPASASLDHARAIARRAERSVVALVDKGELDGTHLLPWLNRLSDVLYLLARGVERRPRDAKGRRRAT